MSQTQVAPLDPDLLVYGLEAPLDPQVSPDGRRVLYRLVGADREGDAARARLMVRDWEGGDGIPLTEAGALDALARWSPDGSQVAFVSDRAEKSGVFVVPAGGGAPRELVRHRWPITALAWSPDGGRIAYTTRVGPADAEEAGSDDGRPPVVRVTRRQDYKLDGTGFIGDARSQVFVVGPTGGTRQLTAAHEDVLLPQWSPDGRTLAVTVGTPGPARLGLVDAAGGEVKLVGPEGGPVLVWSWSPAGDRVVLAADPDRTYQTDFYLHHVASGETVRLTDDPPVLAFAGGGPVPQPPSMPVWLDDGRVAFLGVSHGAGGLYVLDCGSGDVTALRRWEASSLAFGADAARRRFVFAQSSLDRPIELVTFEPDTGAETVLTDHSAACLAGRPAAGWERIDVTRAGETIEAWLLRPPDFDPGRRYPLVLDVHGGPNSWYGFGFTPHQQCLAAHGFLVLFANPRGSGSYGRRFAGMVFGDWGGEDHLDLMAVLDQVRARPYVDAGRLGILGYSYGGYMTSWTIGRTDRFRAAVCGAPCFDLVSHWGTADIGDLWDHVQWGGPPHERAEWYRDRSPSTYAHRVRTPTLVVQGEADDRCPVGQGHHLYTALQNAGCEAELALYPGGSHLFPFALDGRPSQRADYLARVLGWFRDHL